jgi:hypothetical protein
LLSLADRSPEDPEVQEQIARHYRLTRRFWGTENMPYKQTEAYAGLGGLYVQDERYTMLDGKTYPGFAIFMSGAMVYFAHTQL